MRILLIGPLPPPHGGSRVSFARFLAFLRRVPGTEVTHVDLPIRKRKRDGSPGDVASIRTMIRGLAVLPRVLSHDRVMLFSSRGFAFSFGLFLIGAGWIARKPVALRLFGGRPYQRIASRSGFKRRFTDWMLSKTAGISLETETGRNDFPPSLRALVKSVPGYRARSEQPSARSTSDGDVVRFAYAGRVDASKGIDVLFRACSSLASEPTSQNFRVDCYGAYSDEMAEEAQRCPQVRLMGVVENATFLRRLASYDVFIYPSVYDNEGHPGAIIEAMQAGLPMVCTSLPTIMEIVGDHVEGLLVRPGNVEDLAAAMGKLIADPALRRKLAAASSEKGRLFDEEVVLPQLLVVMGGPGVSA